MVKDFDVIIIGSGAALNLVEHSLSHGLKTALVDKGPIGGTCLNMGCIPSKKVIYPADVVDVIKNAKKFGIDVELKSVDFKKVLEETKESVDFESKSIEKSIKNVRMDNFSFYKTSANFVSDYSLDVGNGEIIKGKKIFIAAGARPMIPKIKRIDKIDYLTNENVFSLTTLPKSIAIIGGGYIGVEFAHFFSSFDSKVFIIQHNKQLVPNEEIEISYALKRSLEKKLEVFLGSEILEFKKEKERVKIIFDVSGLKKEIVVEKILIATGRVPNADLLNVEKTGVKLTDKGYISVNDSLETSKKNIWAFGDIIGKEMFRHTANYEANVALENGFHTKKMKMVYDAVPHAIFTSPEIASVGLTEVKARKQGFDVAIGFSKFNSVAKGDTMKDEISFAKAVIDKKTDKILGFHIFGPNASILIQEIVFAMTKKLTRRDIFDTIHIHPSMSEIIVNTLANIQHEHKH